MSTDPKVVHAGGCHCGAVRFNVSASRTLTALDCNCSICAMTGYLHLIVRADDFTLIRGAESITHYKFNTRTAVHQFCRICGIKSFYKPRSHPDGYSINVHCLDAGTISVAHIEKFDGQHWEASIDSLTG